MRVLALAPSSSGLCVLELLTSGLAPGLRCVVAPEVGRACGCPGRRLLGHLRRRKGGAAVARLTWGPLVARTGWTGWTCASWTVQPVPGTAGRATVRRACSAGRVCAPPVAGLSVCLGFDSLEYVCIRLALPFREIVPVRDVRRLRFVEVFHYLADPA